MSAVKVGSREEIAVVKKARAPAHRYTFGIRPIRGLVMRYIDASKVWADPFVGLSPFASMCQFTNDLNNNIPATHHMESLDFLRSLSSSSVDGVLFDPPYSPRQISDAYHGVGLEVMATTTSARFWSERKIEIARIAKPGAIIISCGWNSNGIGYKRGFQQIEILLVSHGSSQHDTIVTVEIKTGMW